MRIVPQLELTTVIDSAVISTAVKGAVKGGSVNGFEDGRSPEARQRAAPAHEPELVHKEVAAHAATAPERLAACAGGESVSYGELNRRANQLARLLLRAGVRPEAGVALLMERSIQMLVAFLAVLRSGAVAVLLDPAHPDERLRQACEQSRATAMLTATGLGRALSLPFPVLCLDPDWDLIHGEAESDPEIRIHPDNIAYLIHTSGSTGAQKRVMVTHRSVAHSTGTHRTAHQIEPADRGSWLAPPGSSVSVGELWPYLSAGASVHAAPPGLGADPQRLRDWMLAERITKAFVSMPVAEQVVGLPWPARTPLRLLTVGSDRVRRWAAADLPFEVAVSFGSSEANGISSGLVPWHRRVTSATADDRLRACAPPVGRAWPQVRLHVLDGALRHRPPGLIGELHVSGPELARGYFGAPGLTALRFVPDPFAADGTRLYRTGDLAHWAPDGELLYHDGRADNEFKINGMRVDPAEVELALLDLPGVRAAVVAPVLHPDGDTVLAAYVVGEIGSADQLRAPLRAQLPDHLVPAVFTVLDALPLNANLKVDRRALPSPDWNALRGGYVAPRPGLEAAIAAIWSEVLEIEGVGARDDFFKLGGNSLAGTRAVRSLARRTGVRVQLRDLLRHPTPEAMAGHLEPAPQRAGSSAGAHD